MSDQKSPPSPVTFIYSASSPSNLVRDVIVDSVAKNKPLPYFWLSVPRAVSGVISKADTVDGTYYSEADSEEEDPAGLTDSHGYITAAAARVVIVIDCDDRSIGKVA